MNVLNANNQSCLVISSPICARAAMRRWFLS